MATTDTGTRRRKRRADDDRLRLWQERLDHSRSRYEEELERMDERERLYLGTERYMRPLVPDEVRLEALHVRNICSELIEAQIDSTIPQPKVTPRRPQDEDKAKLIEDMLRNELDRLPMEQINDMLERTVPIQGGAGLLVEWDATERTHDTIGEISVSTLHPKQIIPQDGVYSGIEDMDYIILEVPQTKEYIRSRYGVDVDDVGEERPCIRKADSASPADDIVTQHIAYYHNGNGGIGLYSWIYDTVLEDMEDYQARRLRRCRQCGAVEPAESNPAEGPTVKGVMPGMVGRTLVAAPDDGTEDDPFAAARAELDKQTRPMARRGHSKTCPYCGGDRWEDSEEEFEEIYVPIQRSDGTVIPGATPVPVVQDDGTITVELQPTRVPFYKPDVYPVLLRKNVSVHGRFLGDSDIDKVSDQQNTINRLEAKIQDLLLAGGSYITLPPDCSVERNTEEMKTIRVSSASDLSMIGVFDLKGDIEQPLAYLNYVYEESRQLIGITDSFQGRRDTTAESGRAKEFSAAQAAGRLESKRIQKQAVFADMFEAMFKFILAYADEPRPVVSVDREGNRQYGSFNRYDFLERDAAGDWAWNDRFLFSCDAAAPLASNREAMWQEMRSNLQTGAFGDPADPETLVMFWSMMEQLHYPKAGDIKDYHRRRLERMMAQQRQQAQMAQMMQQQQLVAQQEGQRQQSQGIDPQTAQAIDRQAQQDAARAAGLV